MASNPHEDPASIIGTQARDDWRLTPDKHADALPASAGPLQRILRSSEITTIIARYHAADILAMIEQTRYRRTGLLTIWARFVALAAGGVGLLPLDGLLDLALRPALIIVQGLALVVSLLAALWLTWRGTFAKWMQARGAAEIARVELFNNVLMTSAEQRTGELSALRLKLEYFGRYQLEVQGAFYSRRGAQHARAAGDTTHWKFVSLGLVALGSVAILYALGLFGDTNRWSQEATQKVIIAAMTLVSAVLAMVSDRSLMDLNERNAARYATTYRNLTELKERYLEPVQEAADRGEEAAVLAFTKVVQEQISSEHREWVLIHDLAPRPELELLLRLPGVRKRVAAQMGTKPG